MGQLPFIIALLAAVALVTAKLEASLQDDNDADLTTDEVKNNLDEPEAETESVDDHNKKVAENRLTLQIIQLVEHYKQEDPIGMPILPVLDPMPIPEIKKSLSLATLHMKNIQAYGMSKFRIKYINSNLNAMKAEVGIQLDLMTLLGNYTLSSLFSKSSGPFTITLKNVFVVGNATIGVERGGKLVSQKIDIDITFTDMAMDFQNLGFMGSVFQSIVNSASNLVFDSIKPFMLSEASTKIEAEINNNLANFTGQFTLPNSISPLDMAISEGRKKIRAMKFDPYHVKDYNHTVGVFAVQISNTWLGGISSIYRVGNITLGITNNTVIVGMEVGTQQLEGSTQWELSIASGMITRTGTVQFTVQHIKVAFVVSQTLDVRNRPQINDIQLDVGNIQIRCDGTGTLDYLIEFFVNVLPNLLRYQITDALENPIKKKIQEQMDKIDMERLIKEKVPDFQKNGFSNFDLDFIPIDI